MTQSAALPVSTTLRAGSPNVDEAEELRPDGATLGDTLQRKGGVHSEDTVLNLATAASVGLRALCQPKRRAQEQPCGLKPLRIDAVPEAGSDLPLDGHADRR